MFQRLILHGRQGVCLQRPPECLDRVGGVGAVGCNNSVGAVGVAMIIFIIVVLDLPVHISRIKILYCNTRIKIRM
jgi:hypothetical protein